MVDLYWKSPIVRVLSVRTLIHVNYHTTLWCWTEKARAERDGGERVVTKVYELEHADGAIYWYCADCCEAFLISKGLIW
jgi:hypothetical protein